MNPSRPILKCPSCLTAQQVQSHKDINTLLCHAARLQRSLLQNRGQLTIVVLTIIVAMYT